MRAWTSGGEHPWGHLRGPQPGHVVLVIPVEASLYQVVASLTQTEEQALGNQQS